MRLTLSLLLLLSLASCKREAASSGAVRLGFFPNVTHAQALVGNLGAFEKAIAPEPLETRQFNAGPTAMEALAGGSLDLSYVGTGPALNAYVKGGGELRILAAAANGGAALVVRGVTDAQGLKGKRLAVPQRGNTQDIALRHWLKQQGLEPEKDVPIVAVPNPEMVGLFKRGDIEGAWVPEPWAARLKAEGGTILVDERTLWPEGRFHTTVLVTTKGALEKRRESIKKLVRAHVELTRRWEQDERAFAMEVSAGFQKLTGAPLAPALLEDAFSRLEPGLRLDPAQLRTAAQHAKELGYLPSDDVAGAVDESLLLEVLAEGNAPAR